MKKIVVASLFFVAALAATTGCKRKPADNIILRINTDIIKYTAYVQIADLADTSVKLSNLHLSIAGKDAPYVYEISGKKDFTIRNGKILLAIDPARVPAAGQPISFVLKVSADNHLPMVKYVNIYAGQKNQNISVGLTSYVTPPAGLLIKTKDFPLTGGVVGASSITQLGKTTKDSVYFDDSLTTIVLPVGTSFYYDSSYVNPIVKKTVIATINGTSTPIEIIVGGDRNFVRVPYKGNTVKVVPLYASGNSIDYEIHDNVLGATDPQIKLLSGSTVPFSKVLYRTAVKQRLYRIDFVGRDNNNDQITIYPDSSSKWFTSAVLDPTTINPNTGQPIKAGDKIEVGVDYYNDTTIVSTVLQAPNGQLRVQSQSVEVGFYYQGTYTYTFNYLFNSTCPSTDVIPDKENLGASLQVNLGSGNVLSYNIPNDNTNFQASATIASKNSITMDDGTLNVSYCGNLLKTQHANQNTALPCYDNAYFTSLPAPIGFKFSIECLLQKKIINPSYYASVAGYSNGKSYFFYCNVIDGIWTTRGLIPGSTYDFYGYIGGYSVSTSQTISAGQNSFSEPLKGDENICKLVQ